MVELDIRRRRLAVSCNLCRRRKIRCNRERPCSNCLRARSVTCIYENTNTPILPRVPQTRPSSSNESTLPILTNHSAAVSPATSLTISNQDAESMTLKARVKQLEGELYQANQALNPSCASTPNSTITQATSSRLSGTFYVHCETTTSGAIARSLSHKTRLLGQSHWEVGGVLLIRDLLEVIEPTLKDETSNAWSNLEKCKKLARDIKARRAPPWPTIPITNLPLKDVTDKLVDCYLRTTESIYRILHIPTFQRDYEAFWVSDMVQDIAFLVQLKLVLAIGAVTYDESFSLRVSALRWIYEAQVWASQPFKLLLDIPSLQIDILLLLAQERVGVGGNVMWILVGSLLRKASYMGLHRDPDRLRHSRTTFAVEMRRRLWNTILELSVQSSLTSGGAPLISLSDFDTEPPRNFTDHQLMADNELPEAANTFTQVSIALALRSSFPQRLAVVKFLNDLASPGSYEETLRLDAQLRTAYKALRQGLGVCSTLSSRPSPSSFEISAVDFLMHRYLSSLHIPYFGPSLTETVYAFSRRVVIDSSLKIWRAACPISADQRRGEATPSSYDDLSLLVTCSSGFYPVAAIHAVFLISMEIRAQLQENEGLGPVPPRPDLISVVEDAKTWCLQVIESGETNVKGYLVIVMIAAQIQGLTRCLGKEEFAKLLVETVENVGKTCLPILQEMMAATSAQDPKLAAVDELEQVSLSDPANKMDDWSFMTPDPLLNLGDTELMSWIFDEDFNSGEHSIW